MINNTTRRSYRYIAVFMMIALCLATLLASSPAQAATNKQVSYNGVTFSYDASLASSVTAETVPEQIADATHEAWWMSHPAHTKFTFNGFNASNSGWEAAIYVFPIKADYKYLNPDQSNDIWTETISETRSFIAQKKMLDPYGYADVLEGKEGSISQIPFLPPINAATVFVGREQFIDFSNGTGFRCFTTIAQDVAPVRAENTIYTYQGTSSDGKYYVAATFPVFLANAPTSSGPGSVVEDIARSRATIKALEESSSDQFSTDLDKLDAVIESLTTAQTPTTPGMPSTGTTATDLTALALLVGLVTLAAGFAMRRTSRT